jgi:hypothetical protein
MSSGNFDEPGNAQTPAAPPENRAQMPAEYYSAPVDESKRIVPRGVLLGCGAAAAIGLLIIFAIGAFLASGGMATFLDFALGQTLGEVRGLYASDVSPAQKQTLEAELDALRKQVRDEKLPITRLSPVLTELQSSIKDRSVRSEEVERLREKIREASAPGTATPKQ